MCDRGGGAKGAAVHANVVFVNIDATQADPARRGLHNQVIPRVSQTPGFVAGYWLEPLAAGRGPEWRVRRSIQRSSAKKRFALRWCPMSRVLRWRVDWGSTRR